MLRLAGNPGHLPRVLDNGRVAPLRHDIIVGLKVIDSRVGGELAVAFNSLRYALAAPLPSGRDEDDVFSQECVQILRSTLHPAAVHPLDKRNELIVVQAALPDCRTSRWRLVRRAICPGSGLPFPPLPSSPPPHPPAPPPPAAGKSTAGSPPSGRCRREAQSPAQTSCPTVVPPGGWRSAPQQ